MVSYSLFRKAIRILTVAVCFATPMAVLQNPTPISATTLTQTLMVIDCPNIVYPGETFAVTAWLCELPGETKIQTAGLTIVFNYVIYIPGQNATNGTDSDVTDSSGNATVQITSPSAPSSTIVVDAIFNGKASLYASSRMDTVSSLPITNSRIKITPNFGAISFHLEDQYLNGMAGQTLSFTTTVGTLSAYSGVTDSYGNVNVTLSGTTAAVVSGSFGGAIINGRVNQPTMARVAVFPGGTSLVQTRTITTVRNAVSPLDGLGITASVCTLPSLTQLQTAGLPFTFYYTYYLYESAQDPTPTVVSNYQNVQTDANGVATFTQTAYDAAYPYQTILVDAVFNGSGNYQVSSNMVIAAVQPILQPVITATSIHGFITFHLGDQYGNLLAGQGLTFTTTSGQLSEYSRMTFPP